MNLNEEHKSDEKHGKVRPSFKKIVGFLYPDPQFERWAGR